MANTGTGGILTTKVRSPIQRNGRGTGSLHENVEHPGHGQTLSAGLSKGERRRRAKNAQPPMIVVIEQWICLVLGLVCMAFGM